MVFNSKTTSCKENKISVINFASQHKNNDEESYQAPEISIVCLGLSIEELNTLEIFFSHLPANIEYAMVIILNYQSRKEKSLIEKLKEYKIKIKVVMLESGMEIQPNVVYVVPYDKHFLIRKNTFQLSEPYTTARKWPIDFGFRVIAEHYNQKAIGIILSGNGTDGTLGLKAIRGEGGLTIIEDPTTTLLNEMPKHALENVQVDFVLKAAEIPTKITEYLSSTKTNLAFEDKIPDTLQRIFYLLRRHVGHDFSSYKQNTICRRIEKRMNVHQIDDITTYSRYLQLHPKETEILFSELLIGVTNFFRNPDAFDILKSEVIPNLIKDKPSDFCLRVWVPGCSTGEEVYSFAIVIKEVFDELKVQYEVQIFGTDIDDAAIETARNGIYPDDISVDVSPERLKRYFVKEENSYRVSKELRKMIIFAAQNIIKDPPFTKLDIVSCRNLLIYLNASLQKKLFPIFYYSLNPSGILFLGTSESISGFNELFDVLNKKWKIFIRKVGTNLAQKNMDFSLIPPLYDASDITYKDKHLRVKDNNLGRLVEKHLLDHYAPTCVLIGDDNNIVYIYGKSAMYLEPAEGEGTLNILEMARPGLKAKLAGAIRKGSNQAKEIVYRNLQISNDSTHLINLIIRPIVNAKFLKKFLLIIFEPVVQAELFITSDKKSNQPIQELKKRVIELEQELKYTKENLQSTIEELETSNEELTSTNEELQSTNEELQSTNEEIETSKEELQSLNEEFATVNAELEHRIDQLSDANDDIKNLLDCTEIATIFLDTEMRVKRFTTRATDLFNFIPSDLGRPINHLVSNLEYDTLIEDAQAVLKTLQVKALEIKNKNGYWYYLRIMPYKTINGVINGVLITVLNINKQKEAENELSILSKINEEREEYIDALENILFEPLLVLNHDYDILSFNKAFIKLFNIDMAVKGNNTITDIIKPGAKEVNDLADVLQKLSHEKEVINNIEMTNNSSKSGKTKIVVNGRKIIRKLSNNPLYLLTFKELHE